MSIAKSGLWVQKSPNDHHSSGLVGSNSCSVLLLIDKVNLKFTLQYSIDAKYCTKLSPSEYNFSG